FAVPGNVRELENVCRGLSVMARGQRIDVVDLTPEVRDRNGPDAERMEARWDQALDRELAQALKNGERNVGERLQREFERTLIRRARVHTGGHRMEAAAWRGWGRHTLTRRSQEHCMGDELRNGGEHAAATHADG